MKKRYGLTDWLSTDAQSAREFFHAVGDNRSQLHHLLAQFRGCPLVEKCLLLNSCMKMRCLRGSIRSRWLWIKAGITTI